MIGVNSQIATAGAGGGNLGIGFAVPSNTVRSVVPRLEQGQAVTLLLGVSTSGDPANLSGAIVQSVVPGGAADKAGIQKGDRIKTIDGQAVQSPTDLSSAVALKQPGDKVKIGIERNGTART